jgi:hypothetical protein
MGFFSIFRSKLERETESEQQELVQILKERDVKREVKLRDLAKKVGARTIRTTRGYEMPDPATESELIENIHQALQTKAMIAAVKTTSNYVIATIILALIALGGVVANFIMAFRN